MRIPNIKHPGELHGGRVFFIREDTNVPGLMEYLERTPVLLYLKA
jgi:pimeloyl-CoA synthetase